MEKNLPNGFITVEEAIDIINKDSRDAATVDVDFLVAGIPYMRIGGTYNIRLMKHKDGRAVYNGEKFVLITTEYERTMLEHAIVEHFKHASGRLDYDPNTSTVRSLSTAIDDEENPKAKIVRQKKPMTSAGEDIADHGVSTTNGQDK